MIVQTIPELPPPRQDATSDTSNYMNQPGAQQLQQSTMPEENNGEYFVYL